MIDELLPNMIKAIKIRQGHKVSTKKQQAQTQVQNQQSTTHNAKMLHELLLDRYEKNHQNTVGTQADYKGTKNANESSKATKYCAQQQKWYMN